MPLGVWLRKGGSELTTPSTPLPATATGRLNLEDATDRQLTKLAGRWRPG